MTIYGYTQGENSRKIQAPNRATGARGDYVSQNINLINEPPECEVYEG